MTKFNEKPRKKDEDEYFTRQDAELMKQLREKLDAERKAQERKQHYMKCPKCGADLEEVDMHGVKVDVCPECSGMWLDAGEIEVLRQVQTARGNIVTDMLDFFQRGRK